MTNVLSEWIDYADKNNMPEHKKCFWIIRDKLDGKIKGIPDYFIKSIDFFEKNVTESDNKKNILTNISKCI